ncbi:MAG: response regulator transcription factor [Bacteroidia bacterium]|nr:response regulator transcription factor [Bacteroidia bacterium]
MDASSPLSIIIADDHQIVIDGLKSLLANSPDIKVIGEANSGSELLRTLSFIQPNLLILDVNMPGMDGVEICAKVKHDFPDIAVLALTMHNDKGVIQAMMKAGAMGYLLKNTSREELLEAIGMVHAGHRFFGAEVLDTLSQGGQSRLVEASQDFLPAGFTAREKEILRLIADGYSNTEIGDQLGISHRTVDTHRTNLMKKVGARNIAGLIRYAFRHGIST